MNCITACLRETLKIHEELLQRQNLLKPSSVRAIKYLTDHRHNKFIFVA